MTLPLFRAAAIASLLLATPAPAQDSVTWRTIGWWQIMVDRTVGDGCFVMATYTDGTIFRTGFSPATRNAYVLIGNRAWKSIEEGKQYDLVVEFDQYGPWSIPATAYRMEPDMALSATTSDVRWFEELAKSHELRISYRGREFAKLGLKDSRAAVDAMLECQTAIGMPTDPFEDQFPPPAPATDPFK